MTRTLLHALAALLVAAPLAWPAVTRAQGGACARIGTRVVTVTVSTTHRSLP